MVAIRGRGPEKRLGFRDRTLREGDSKSVFVRSSTIVFQRLCRIRSSSRVFATVFVVVDSPNSRDCVAPVHRALRVPRECRYRCVESRGNSGAVTSYVWRYSCRSLYALPRDSRIITEQPSIVTACTPLPIRHGFAIPRRSRCSASRDSSVSRI